MIWTISMIEKILLPFCTKHNIDEVILYGSRARYTNSETSDVDLAVIGKDYASFKNDVMRNARTLLLFDIVDYNTVSVSLKEEIDRHGRVLYRKE